MGLGAVMDVNKLKTAWNAVLCVEISPANALTDVLDLEAMIDEIERLQKRLALAEAVCEAHDTIYDEGRGICLCPYHEAWREARDADR